jgi:CRP/FNR family transcriptional regulator, cyclic AMP receptor protein
MSKNKGSRFEREEGPRGRWKHGSRISEESNCLCTGEVAEAVFYLQKGWVKLTVVSEKGNKAVLGILETGYFLW